MNFPSTALSILLPFSLALTIPAAAEEREAGPVSKAGVEKLLKLLETERSPEVYGAVYYPRWKTPLDGLKSVTAEAIAENAERRMKDGIRLEVVGEPHVDGELAGVLLKRSGGNVKEGTFPAYLFRDETNGWGFLGLPIPYKAPLLLGRDGKFMEKALTDPTPYDGVLYEFDEATKARYAAIAKKLETNSGKEGKGAEAGNG